MPKQKHDITAVPKNIITGFLGVGKTSTILHLLKHKPDNERWAVLVNEFGEIGVDGSLVSGTQKEDSGVFISEVPGGCMCCAAGLPMQIALNQLLQRARPDRLLIEPTGLGHPQEVLQVLSSEHYKDVLDLQKIITLVDARNLSDPRYTGHETFRQQIAIADTVVGHKQDLYAEEDASLLESYIAHFAAAETKLTFAQNGAISSELLYGSTRAIASLPHHHHHADSRPMTSELDFPDCGYLRAMNSGEGYKSVGWRFASRFWFDRDKLISFMKSLRVERLKAVFISETGIFAYNLTRDSMTEQELDECMESRLEIIADNIDDTWEKQLLACVVQSN